MKHFFTAALALLFFAATITSAVAHSCSEDLPRTQGYWNNHPDAWPVLMVTAGNQEIGRDFAIENILAEPTRGDAVLILLSQLVPAKLNIAGGVSDAAVASYIANADEMLESLWIGSDMDTNTRRALIDIAARLDEFNNGAFCSLPVELTSFDAQADGTLVMLRWATASEDNNAGFDVEYRRGNGYGFETLDFVAGNGSSTATNNYALRLANLGFGKHTFRLRQVDLDGTFSYSSEVEIDVELTERYALTDAYPNPFNPTTNIRFSLRETGEIHLAVYDLVGRQVKTLASGNFAAGSHDVTFSADNLPSGTYLYRLQTQEGPITGTLVLLK